MKREVMDAIERNMKRLATSLADGFGAEAEVDFRVAVRPDGEQRRRRRMAYGDAAAELVGRGRTSTATRRPAWASEDFSFMMEQVPGAHINFGNGESAAVHNDLYDFNDEAIPYGVALFAGDRREEAAEGDCRTDAGPHQRPRR